MAVQKRNRLKLWGVTFAWLVGTRFALVLTFGLVIGIFAYARHPHDSVGIKAASQQIAASLAPVLLLMLWTARLGIILLAKSGKLPGTAFPESPSDLAAVFRDDEPMRASRNEAQPAPAPMVHSPLAPRTFGRRRPLVTNG